jgi:hypothetical protein
MVTLKVWLGGGNKQQCCSGILVRGFLGEGGRGARLRGSLCPVVHLSTWLFFYWLNSKQGICTILTSLRSGCGSGPLQHLCWSPPLNPTFWSAIFTRMKISGQKVGLGAVSSDDAGENWPNKSCCVSFSTAHTPRTLLPTNYVAPRRTPRCNPFSSCIRASNRMLHRTSPVWSANKRLIGQSNQLLTKSNNAILKV